MAKPRPIQLEDLFRLRVVNKLAIAPDARRVAFELKRCDLAENRNFTQLMLVDVESGQMTPITAEARHNDTRPQWSPDGSQIAFLSDREKTTCLFIMSMKGGEPHRVTDRDGAISDFSWSPDGRRLAYAYHALTEREKLEREEKSAEAKKLPHYRHTRRLDYKLDGAGFSNGLRTHIYIIDAAGGKPRQLTRGDFDHSEPRFSPDGRQVSFVANRDPDPDLHATQAAIHVSSARGDQIKRLTHGPGEASRHAWSPDGSSIAFLGRAGGDDSWWKHDERICLIPATGGKPRELTGEIDNVCTNTTIGDVAGPTWDPPPVLWSADGQRIYFVVSEQGATRLYSRSVNKRDARVEVAGEVNVFAASQSRPGGAMALAIGSGTNPADVYLFDPARGGPPRRLTDVNGAILRRLQVGQPEEFWLTRGRTRVQGWLLKPPGFDPRRKYPAILEIHGGPQAQYGHSFLHEIQWLAAKGYVVAYANPRGSTGYGLDFRRCIVNDWGNLDYADVRAVADWLFARPFVDRRRVGVTGGSYGGFMTNWIVGHETRFRAAVTQRSVTNFESMFGTSDFGYLIIGQMGASPWSRHEKLRRMSPLTYADRIRTPLLIEHEEQDHRCSIEQAEQLFAALKLLGREVEFLRFEGESHGLSRGGRPQNRAERLRRLAGWFDKHMK